MVDIRGAPEVSARGDITKLHHPGRTPKVIRLLGTVVVRDIVLIKIRRHAVKEGHCERVRVVIEELDHAARRNAWLGDITRSPRNIHVAIYVVIERGLRHGGVLCSLFMAGLTGVVLVQHQTALV